MSDLKENIAAFETERDSLEARFQGRWVVFHERRLAADHATFDEAASDATARFDPGTFMIRQVGAEIPALPSSLLFGTGRAA
jgi:hypothetical protein